MAGTKLASISSDVTHLSASFDAAAATPLIPFSMKSDASLVPSINVMHGLESCRASATAARVKALVVIKIPFAVELSAPRKPLISTLPTACRQRLTCAWTCVPAKKSASFSTNASMSIPPSAEAGVTDTSRNPLCSMSVFMRCSNLYGCTVMRRARKSSTSGLKGIGSVAAVSVTLPSSRSRLEFAIALRDCSKSAAAITLASSTGITLGFS